MFWKVINKKMSLTEFLLKDLSRPIHPPITMPKTDSTASVSFACSEKLQNCWKSVCGGITFYSSKRYFYVLQLYRKKSKMGMVCSEKWLS